MLIGDILQLNAGIALFNGSRYALRLGCPSSQMESLEDACAVHGKSVGDIIGKINALLANQ